MAEGWLKHLFPEFEAYSAGILARGMNTMAARVMAEAGIDIGTQHSKTIESLPFREIDYVFTLCGSAAENCPYFAARTRLIHVPFDDPPGRVLASELEPESPETVEIYARVRDEIRDFVRDIRTYLE